MKIIDMHCDTISKIREMRTDGNATGLRENNLMLDLLRMKKCGYSVQNFALFVEMQKGKSPFLEVKQLLTIFQQEMEENAELISQVCTAEQIQQNEKAGKMSALLTVEEGGVCEGKIENLHYLYQQGVRMLTLTWNFPNEIGYPNFNMEGNFYTPNTKEGLTAFGIEFVQEMERLGMLIDVSHLSDAGFYDVLEYTKKPFVASHSNARALCPVVRNLTDDMLRKLASRGGVAGINYCSDFLKEGKGRTDIDGRDPKNWGGGCASIEDIARHARHMADVGGVDCIGLGSDFDGIPPYPGLSGVEVIWQIAEWLKKYQFHESEIDKILYENVFRVYKEL